MTKLTWFFFICLVLILPQMGLAVELPEAKKTSDKSLLGVLNNTQVQPPRISNSFSVPVLTQLLWSMQGISHPPARTVPSAGATYPLDVYTSLRIPITEGLDKGSYHYRPEGHELMKINNQVLKDEILDNLDLDAPDNLKSVPVVFMVSAEYSRTSEKYGGRAVRYVHLEVGHLIQNLKLQARSLGVDLEFRFSFNTTLIQDHFNTPFHPLLLCFAWTTLNNIPEFNHQNTLSVEEAIQNRRSIRDYLDQSIPSSDMVNLIEYSVYRTQSGKLVIPPIVASVSVNVYLSMSNVEGFADAIYRYYPKNKSFTKIVNESMHVQIYDASLHQNWIVNSPARIILTLDKGVNATDPVAQMELGRIGQNLYLVTQAFSMGMVVVGAFIDSWIQSILLLPEDEQPFYIIPVGKVPETPSVTLFRINLKNWSALFGWMTIGFFYLSALLKTPPLRKRIPKTRLFHLLLGLVGGFTAGLHLILGHGGWHTLISPTSERIHRFFRSSLLSSSTIGDPNIYNFVLDLTRVGTWLTLIFGILSMLAYYSIIKNNRVITHILHRYWGHLILVFMLLHAVINGAWFTYLVNISVFVIIGMSMLYVTLYNIHWIIQWIPTKNDQSS